MDVRQEVVLALLAKEPSHGYDLRAPLGQALGPHSRIAATADRLVSMRDGEFADETRLTGGTGGRLADLAGLEG